MKCSPKCEWQIQAPWGELSHRQLSPHLQESCPLSAPPPLALNHGSGQLAFNVTSWGNPRAPPVFLAHGRQDCATTFQPLLELMNPEEFYYVSIDMPGSGNSTPFPVVAIPQNRDDETLANAMSNLNIHGQKQTICRSSQKRKRGMKLMKTPDDSIVCNDHGGRECPFARSAFQEPSERVFYIRGLKKSILPSHLRRKLARGWSGRFWFTWRIENEEAIQDPDQAVSESSTLSPLSLFEDIDDNDSNLSTECGLSECPHLPAGLLDWLHIFYKDGGMPNYANRPVADPWADDVQQSPTISPSPTISQSPTISDNEYPVDMPSIYETFPQTYSYVRDMHNYAKRPVVDPWANDDEQSPIFRHNQEPLHMPSMYEAFPERDTYAPKVRLYNPGYFARTSSNISPGPSSYTDIARPGLYTPIGTAPGYNYEYMHPDRYAPEPAHPPQHRPFCLSPWTYFDEVTPSSSNSQFVPCPVQANGLPCCFNNIMQTHQESIHSNSFSRQERNNDDYYNAELAVSPSANDGGGARADREPGNGSRKAWNV